MFGIAGEGGKEGRTKVVRPELGTPGLRNGGCDGCRCASSERRLRASTAGKMASIPTVVQQMFAMVV
jgi:hypothetical protein